MSLLSNFGINTDNLKVNVEDLDKFARKSNTTVLTLNQTVKVPGSLNGIAIPTWATLRNAEWHRITVRDHEINRVDEPTRISQVVGLSFRNVKIDVEVELNGTRMSLQDFARTIASDLVGTKDVEVLDAAIAGCGLNFDSMPMFLQQMGASIDGFSHAIEQFKTFGAYDDMNSVKNNPSFHTAWAIPKNQPGIKVTSFEMTPADRSQSATGQGFVDLVDAVMGNFLRMWEHKSAIVALNQKKESATSQAEVKSIESEIKNLTDMVGNYGSSWSGTVRAIDRVTKMPGNRYYPMNIPCGRWTALVADKPVDFDVWSNSEKKPSEGYVSAVNTPAVDPNEKPF